MGNYIPFRRNKRAERAQVRRERKDKEERLRLELVQKNETVAATATPIVDIDSYRPVSITRFFGQPLVRVELRPVARK